jgi:hypothetical protein
MAEEYQVEGSRESQPANPVSCVNDPDTLILSYLTHRLLPRKTKRIFSFSPPPPRFKPGSLLSIEGGNEM